MRWYRFASGLSLIAAFSLCGFAQGPLQVSANNLPPSTTTNVKSVQVMSLNLFRYDALLNVQDKTANPPTPPTGFMPTAVGPGAAAKPAVAAAPTPEPAVTPAATPAADPLQPLEDKIKDEEKSLTQLTGMTQNLLNNAVLATACFKDLQGRYPQLLLTTTQRTSLINDLNNASDCKWEVEQWPYDQIGAAINVGPEISNLFVQLNVATANDPGKTLLARHTGANLSYGSNLR
jgi:hypothetical protein